MTLRQRPDPLSSAHKWWRVALVGAGLAAVAVHSLVIGHRRAAHPGDFDISREFGRRFLAGDDLYAGGLHYPYLPSAAMYFSPLALLPPGVGLALRYAVALACVGLTFSLLARLLAEHHPRVQQRRLPIAGLTSVLAAHYIIRDLDDGGPHLILLGLVVGGIYLAWKRRDVRAALCFGLGAALKAPLVLLLPFFLWRQRWRLAAFSALATLGWVALPALWMGVGSWWSHQQQWSTIVAASALGRPLARADANERRVQNQALKPTLMRYLAPTTQDPPHPLAPLGGTPPIDLPRSMADGLATMALVGLLVACGWRDQMVQRTTDTGGQPPAHNGRVWLLECGAALVLSVVLAPLAWVQHLVLLIPALYLIVADHLAGDGSDSATRAAVAVYALLALVANRELLGRDVYLCLLAAGLHTVCMLIVLAIILRQPILHAD